ncbi:unnamed protein product [Owenia fusiformis]|uniref:Uncharacterized protein n=1 Tax=Owenia fusiformis TaxID=6347 RepID=A0A8J1UT01_OWEFU|nr:unnamed protein product [Owenia fusiformis]
MEFLRKAVIVTGSSQGIGKAIALNFAKLGANVLIHGRNESALKATQHECRTVGQPDAKFPIVRGDILKNETMKSIVDEAMTEFSRIDVLVNNAGGAKQMGSILDATMTDLDYELNIHFKVPLHMTQLSYPELKKTQGNIVNISSFLGVRPNTTIPFYTMSRAALNMFTQCAALEFSPDGVRINAVAPGYVETNVFLNMGFVSTIQEQKDIHTGAAKAVPLRKLATVEDVAKAVVFTASSPSMQGEILVLDGGHSLVGQDAETLANAAKCN